MNGRWVLDASAAIRIVQRADGALDIAQILENASLVIAPTLHCAETANALWKYVLAGRLEPAQGVERTEEARNLVDRFVADCDLQTEALALAMQFDQPVYDALYAVLARRHAAGVITRDERLRRLLLTQSIAVA